METETITGTTMPIELRQAAFLLERLAADCAPLQEYRELTCNSLEAIGRAVAAGEVPDAGHQVYWDVEWKIFQSQLDAGEKPVYKLSIWDTGDGMTGEEMVKYINHLSSSVGVQALDRNFGVGAKITAGVSNPHGLVYTSYKNGEVHQIHFWRDPETNEYGIKPFRRKDGTFHHWRKLRPEVLPDEIIKAGHGTMVTLLGSAADVNTAERPDGAVGGVRWLVRYLNRRFLRFPENVTVRVREFSSSDPANWPQQATKQVRHGGMERPAVGQEFHLNRNAEANGKVRLKEGKATAHWWLLKEDKIADPSYWLSTGHVAAVFQDELYELRDGNPGIRQLMQFGVLFGSRRVVIYVEPDLDQKISPNTARSQLLAGGEPLPWDAWAAEFRSRIPKAIDDMMAELLSRDADSEDLTENIKARLKRIEDIIRTTRYRRTPDGSTKASGEAPGGEPGEGDTEKPGGGGSGGSGGTTADIYGAYVDEEDGEPADPVLPTPTFPDIEWVSIAKGTRSLNDPLEDRAASYQNSTQNTLLINEDFRVYTDLVTHFMRAYEGYSGTEKTVPEVVKEWYAQQLVETVVGVLAVKGSAKWTQAHVDQALSEEALTAAVMPRYHLFQQVSRALGQKLGSLKERAE